MEQVSGTKTGVERPGSLSPVTPRHCYLLTKKRDKHPVSKHDQYLVFVTLKLTSV